MKRLLLLLLSIPAFAQTYTVGNLGTQTNSTPFAFNLSCVGHNSAITSITTSGTGPYTVVVNLAAGIAGGPCGGGVGNSVQIVNTFTGQDGTYTTTAMNNSTPGSVTFTSASNPTFSSTFRYDHVGTLVKDLSGTVWNFWHEASQEATGIGWIQMKTSTNNGSTWTTPVTLFSDPSSTDCQAGTSQCDWRNQEAGITANGNILLSWGAHDWGATAGWQAMYYAYYNGTSWSSAIPITVVPSDQTPGSWDWCSPYGATVNLPGGAIGIMAAGQTTRACPTPAPEYLLISCDNGVTLGTGTGCTGAMAQYAATPIRRITATAPFVNPPTNEITLAWIGGTTLLGYDRNNPWTSGCTAPCGQLAQYVSNDLGVTWSVSTTNLGAYTAGETTYTEVSPLLYKPELGNLWWLIWGDRYTASATNKFALRAQVISPSFAIANPNSYLASPDVLYSISGWSLSGYPGVVSTGTNQFLVQWDSLGQGTTLSLFTNTGSFIPPTATVVQNAVINNMVLQ